MIKFISQSNFLILVSIPGIALFFLSSLNPDVAWDPLVTLPTIVPRFTGQDSGTKTEQFNKIQVKKIISIFFVLKLINVNNFLKNCCKSLTINLFNTKLWDLAQLFTVQSLFLHRYYFVIMRNERLVPRPPRYESREQQLKLTSEKCMEKKNFYCLAEHGIFK